MLDSTCFIIFVLMEIVQLIKDICTTNDWSFNYGSGDWLNLSDSKSEFRKPFSDRKIHALLYTVSSNITFNDFGGEDNTTHNCILLLGVSSNFNDKDYNKKYEENLKPLLESKLSILKDGLNSCEYKLSGSMSVKEFSNLMDNNLDGLNLEFTIEKA